MSMIAILEENAGHEQSCVLVLCSPIKGQSCFCCVTFVLCDVGIMGSVDQGWENHESHEIIYLIKFNCY